MNFGGEIMAQFVEYPMPAGGKLVFERSGAEDAYGPATSLVSPAKAEQTFREALSSVKEVSSELLSILTDLATKPEKVEVEFGINLAVKAGVIVTSGSVDANFKVKLTWQNPEA
jgi:hypothetical protein